MTRVESMKSRVCKFNLWLVGKVVDWNSTAIAIYAVAFVVLFSLVLKRPENPYEWVVFLSSAFYQAVMLPVILVSNKIQAERAIKHHNTEMKAQFALLSKELHLLHQLCGENGPLTINTLRGTGNK